MPIPTDSSSARWALSDTARHLLRKPVDDGCVVYDTASGQTRLLSPLSEFILDVLADGPATGPQLLDAVHAQGEEDGTEDAAPEGPADEALASIQETLQALAHAGLLISTP